MEENIPQSIALLIQYPIAKIMSKTRSLKDLRTMVLFQPEKHSNKKPSTHQEKHRK